GLCATGAFGPVGRGVDGLRLFISGRPSADILPFESGCRCLVGLLAADDLASGAWAAGAHQAARGRGALLLARARLERRPTLAEPGIHPSERAGQRRLCLSQRWLSSPGHLAAPSARRVYTLLSPLRRGRSPRAGAGRGRVFALPVGRRGRTCFPADGASGRCRRFLSGSNAPGSVGLIWGQWLPLSALLPLGTGMETIPRTG